MLRWSDVIECEARIEALRCEASHERWTRTIASVSKRQPRFYHIVVFWLGGRLTFMGQRLQKRYAVMVEPPFTPKIESNQGAC